MQASTPVVPAGLPEVGSGRRQGQAAARAGYDLRPAVLHQLCPGRSRESPSHLPPHWLPTRVSGGPPPRGTSGGKPGRTGNGRFLEGFLEEMLGGRGEPAGFPHPPPRHSSLRLADSFVPREKGDHSPSSIAQVPPYSFPRPSPRPAPLPHPVSQPRPSSAHRCGAAPTGQSSRSSPSRLMSTVPLSTGKWPPRPHVPSPAPAGAV